MQRTCLVFKLLCVSLILINNLNGQLLNYWPASIDNTTQMSNMVGTVGEYRHNPHRFHKGVDFTASNSTLDRTIINPGRCIDGCEVTDIYTHSYSGRIEITDYHDGLIYKFVHVKTNFLIDDEPIKLGQHIESGQSFTEMLDLGGATHLHFEIQIINGETQNPLKYLPNYTDNSRPTRKFDYLGIRGFKFHRQGLTKNTTSTELNSIKTINSLDYILLYDKMDIQAHLIDPRNPTGGGQCAPYVLEYSIFKQKPMILFAPELIEEINFNTLYEKQSYCFDIHPANNGALYCFGPQSNHPASPTIAILTANPFFPPYDRYWNTALKKDYNQVWPASASNEYTLQNARANEEAHYSDGTYVLDICAEDYRPVGQNGRYCIPREDTRVIIDNFMPYVKSVSIHKGGLNGYKETSQWVFNSENGTISFVPATLEDVPNNLLPFNSGQLEIEIIFSEPIKASSLVVNAIYKEYDLNLQTYPMMNPTNVDYENTNFIYNLNVSPGNNPSRGELSFVIEAEDYAGNPILAMQSKNENNYTIPKRINNATFQPAVVLSQEGTDNIHKFSFEGCILPQGLEGPVVDRGGDCTKVDFTYHIGENGCMVIFEDISQGFGVGTSHWDFGDGSLLGVNTKTTEKYYEEKGCYEVTLSRYSMGDAYSKTKTVCLNFCGDDFNNFLECQINGPVSAKAGQTINLSASGYGIAPFSYSWGQGSFNLTKIGENGNSATYLVNEAATNGSTELIYLEVFDSFGNSTTCIHSVTINGNLPDFDVAVFGTLEPNTYLYFLGFIDIFNTSGFVDYQFAIYDENNIELITTSWNFDYGYGTCYGPSPFCLEEGYYKVVAKARDDNGEYEAFRNFTIGDPIYVPPSPPMEFSCFLPSNCKLQNGNRTIVLNYDGIWPFTTAWFGNCQRIYLQDIKLKNLNTGQEINMGIIEPINTWNLEDLNFSVPCDWIGTIQIDATAYQEKGCNQGWINNNPPWDETEPYQMPTFFIERYPSSPNILDLNWSGDISSCSNVIEAEVIGGCSPYTYEWKFFDFETDEEVEEIATFQDNFATIDLNHAFFYDNRHKEYYQFRGEVLVTDVNGKSGAISKTFQGRMPLLGGKLPSINVCQNSSVTIGNLYTGGSGSLDFTWLTGDLNNISFDLELNKYIFNAPIGAQENQLFYYTYEIEDLECEVIKHGNISIYIKDISIDFPLTEINFCNDGTGDKKFNPIVSGGSGNYSYSWNSGQYLDASNQLNPRIVLPEGITEQLEFQLIVTDDHGCTVTSEEVTLIPGRSAWAVGWVTTKYFDESYCYNSENEISAQAESPYGYENMLYEWNNDNWSEPKNTRIINFGSEITKQPGSHTIKLKVSDPEFGCSRIDDIDFEVLDQIKYRGYITEARGWRLGGGPNYNYDNLWTSSPAQNTIVSPSSQEELNYAFSNGVPTITHFNSHDIPSAANYSPFWSEGKDVKMRVYNDLNCYNDISTNRYIMFTSNAKMEIFSDSPSFICQGDEFNLKVVVTIDVAKNAHLMPKNILLSFRQTPYLGGGYFQYDTGILTQIASPGRYEGIITLKPTINYGNWWSESSYEFVCSLDPSKQVQHPWNNTEIMSSASTAKGIFIFGGGAETPITNSTLDVCEQPPYNQGSSGSSSSELVHAVTLTLRALGNCGYTYVPSGYEMRAVGKTKDGSVNISNLIVDEGGFFKAIINPCLILGPVLRSEYDEDIIDLTYTNDIEIEIFPNPTNGNLNVQIMNFQSNWTESTFNLEIVDLLGNILNRVFQNDVLKGKNDYLIDVGLLSSGSYILRLTNTAENLIVNKIFFKI